VEEVLDAAAIDSLVDHYNAVVRRVLDFRWRHLSYIEEYVIKPSGGFAHARGTGGTPAFAYLNQHINDTEAALIPTASSPRERHHNHTHAHHGHVHGHSHGRTAAIDAPSGTNDDSQAPSVIVEPELGADHASIGDLWEVTDARGLLPARTPIGADALPPAWRGVAALLIRLPGACVPPAVFRDHLREAAARGDLPPPEAIDELHSEDQLERARCV